MPACRPSHRQNRDDDVRTDGHGRAPSAPYSGFTCAAELSVHPAGSACGPGSRGRAAGKAGPLMTGLAIRESVTVVLERSGRGLPGCSRARCLVPGTRAGDDAALLVSEFFGNSLRHSGSGAPVGTVTVAVRSGGGIVRWKSLTATVPGVPERCPADGGCGRRRRPAARCGHCGAMIWLSLYGGGAFIRVDLAGFTRQWPAGRKCRCWMGWGSPAG